jgi:hypothetical protein
MSYEIRKYDGTVLLTLNDGIADTGNSSLTFIGKNLSNFGKQQNENFLYLLENFAGNTEPANPLRGQLWYDTTNYVIRLYNGGEWAPQSVLEYTDSVPAGSHPGYMWFDSINNQLYVKGNSDFILVGPERVNGFGITKLVSTNMNGHPVIEIVINDELLGIISTGTFSTSTVGFPTVYRGITLKDYSTTDFQLYGRSVFANLATTSTNINGGLTGQVLIQSSPGHTGFISTASLNVGHAVQSSTSNNISSGTAGALLYQDGVGSTDFIPLDSSGYILTAGATKPVWTDVGSISVAYADAANYANSAGTSTNAELALESIFLLNEAEDTFIRSSTGSNAITIVERDANGNIWGNFFAGTAMQANYADLAEKYLADAEYEIGTVVSIGGEKEITACTSGDRAVGVVSGNPAYLMNKDLQDGTAVALKGRVPCKVFGKVQKGQRLVAYNDGSAIVGTVDVFAVSLENNNEIGVRIVEVLVL